MLSLIEKGKIRKTNFVSNIRKTNSIRRIGIKASKCSIFALIPLFILLFYGIEDKKADFFENGDGVRAEYKIIYNRQAYYIGEIVSHWSLIVTLSVVGLLISWIFYEVLKVSKLPIRKYLA